MAWRADCPTRDLASEMACVMIEQDEMFLSHDVSLFNNTAIDDTLHIIRKRLEEDSTLKLRTKLQVGTLWSCCSLSSQQHCSASWALFANRSVAQRWEAQCHRDSQSIYGMAGTTSHRHSSRNVSAPTMEAIRG